MSSGVHQNTIILEIWNEGHLDVQFVSNESLANGSSSFDRETRHCDLKIEKILKRHIVKQTVSV